MHCFNLLLLAVAALAGPGTLEERDEAPSPDEVQLSMVTPFEPWPGYFQGKSAHESRSIQKRSHDSVAVCRAWTPAPPGGWRLQQAVCNRKNPNRDTFWVNCQNKDDPPLYVMKMIAGVCGKDKTCIEFHGQNELGQQAFDINCVSRYTLREWFLDSVKAEHGLACSPSYVNNVDGKNAVNMSLQTNVLDSAKLNRIAPANIYYLLDDKTKIGVERPFDADVGSGIITVPHGSKVKACVQAVIGQTLWAFVAISALALVPPSGSGS